MKANPNTASSVKSTSPKPLKSASRKSKTALKRASGSPNKSGRAGQSAMSGYSDAADRFLRRGKSALGEAYNWAGETGKSLPESVRKMGLPDQKSIETFLSERPLVLGAVGLGLGVVLGAMLPAIATAQKPKASSARRK